MSSMDVGSARAQGELPPLMTPPLMTPPLMTQLMTQRMTHWVRPGQNAPRQGDALRMGWGRFWLVLPGPAEARSLSVDARAARRARVPRRAVQHGERATLGH